jgi:UDP-2,3-diacylglucosamine pyrophosphatase LpxH
MEIFKHITNPAHALSVSARAGADATAGFAGHDAAAVTGRWDVPLVLSRHGISANPQEPPLDSAQVLDAVIISDIHLGCDNCQAKLVISFLQDILEGRILTRRLMINGDVFDSIDFRRLKKTHWKVLSMIRHLSDKLEVVWTCGNHDGPAEIISHLLGVAVRDETIFTSGNRRVLVLHGHIFDDFIDDHPILTWIGDLIYNTLQQVDRRHYIARLAKARSKIFLHCLDKVRRKSTAYARKLGCDVVLCGHTHHADQAIDHGVQYFNSGCWTELPPTWLAVRDGHVTICRYQPESAPMSSSARSALAGATGPTCA